MSNIKILIACHKPTDYVENNIFQPIQVGAALADKKLECMMHDDKGNNISELNKQYCELTAIYWAWKNIKADYYGLFHYRRYLSFNDVDKKPDDWGNLIDTFIDDLSIEKYGLTEARMQEVVNNYDIIIPRIKDTSRMPGMKPTIWDQFAMGGNLHIEDLQIMMDVLGEKYPEYVETANKYLHGSQTYLNNMFVMKKEIFMPYAAWLFDILEECRKRIDITDYSIEAIRTLGHLAERLLNIYILQLEKTSKYRIKELDTIVFTQTDIQEPLLPAFETNNVAIALSADEYYVPYVSAVIHSIKDNMNSGSNYDIIVMNRNITSVSQQRLKSIVEDVENATVRFFNVSRYENKVKNLFVRGHFRVETYFRLLMPEIMPAYKKVLYLDSDLIVNADLAELYNTDIKGYLLAASLDADTAGLYNGFEPQKKHYMDTILKIEKPYEYFQAGVILFNLEEFRKSYTSEEMLKFAASYEWELLDQDVLNYLAQGKYKKVDMAWNTIVDWQGIRISQIIAKAPKYLNDAYMEARKNPKIIHYAGPDKPWQIVDSDFAELFWKYARKSVYYELLMERLSKQAAREVILETPAEPPLRIMAKKAVYGRRKLIAKLFPQYTRRRQWLLKLMLKFRKER